MNHAMQLIASRRSVTTLPDASTACLRKIAECKTKEESGRAPGSVQSNAIWRQLQPRTTADTALIARRYLSGSARRDKSLATVHRRKEPP